MNYSNREGRTGTGIFLHRKENTSALAPGFITNSLLANSLVFTLNRTIQSVPVRFSCIAQDSDETQPERKSRIVARELDAEQQNKGCFFGCRPIGCQGCLAPPCGWSNRKAAAVQATGHWPQPWQCSRLRATQLDKKEIQLNFFPLILQSKRNVKFLDFLS